MSHPPTLLDREAHMRARLKDRLALLDAQEPALEALYNSLSPDQKHDLDHMHMHGGMRDHMMGRGMMHGGMGGWHHGGPGGMQDGAPPDQG